MLHNVVKISAAQQRESVTRIHMSSPSGPHVQGRKRDRHREWTGGHSGGRGGWDALGGEVSHIYTVLCSLAQSRPTLFDPTDCGPPGSSVHGISQAGIAVWVAISR